MKTSPIRLIIKDDHVKKDGTSALCLEVRLDGKKIRFPLNISWSVAHFDKTKGRIKARHKADVQCNDYTLIIKGKEADLTAIFTHYRLAKKPLSLELLKKEYYNWHKREDFYAYWWTELSDRNRRGKIEHPTYMCHKASYNKMKQFKASCTFAELTPKLIENFQAWMKAKLGNRPATVQKTLKDVRTYVNLAIRDKYAVDNPFKIIKVRNVEVIKEVLTLDQVQQLLDLYEQADLPPSWYCVLQHFLFSCFTGLRISDIQRVKAEHIIDGALVFNAHKTRNSKHKTLSIPLHPIARRFITVNVGRLFDTYTDQYTNRLLHKIADHLEWTTRVSTHTARHTFGTNFIELGGDVVTLQGYMGHSKIQTTMQYVHLSERRKREQINVFDHFNK
ncbi:tyrosine-type recombinase/integrase [Fibrella aquatica]|uniref:tyrosine-type recombinase/integrase n=1 Tax=Fibrella aquatica TaxID=3242487 RepID=UPI00351F9F72